MHNSCATDRIPVPDSTDIPDVPGVVDLECLSLLEPRPAKRLLASYPSRKWTFLGKMPCKRSTPLTAKTTGSDGRRAKSWLILFHSRTVRLIRSHSELLLTDREDFTRMPKLVNTTSG